MSVLNSATSAIQAAQTRLQVTSHNIANASTPGYARQEVNAGSLPTRFMSGEYIGGGVVVQDVERQYNQFLTREVHSAYSMLQSDRARSDSLSQLDHLFSDTENGIGARYDAFNSALADSVNRPQDEAARTVALERARDFAAAVRNGAESLERIQSDTGQRIELVATQLNEDLAQMAMLNEQIASSISPTGPSNDLLDQRDALIERINGQLQVSTYLNDDGTASLFTVSGDALVIATDSQSIEIGANPSNPGRLSLMLQTNGNAVPLRSENLGGGELSGLLSFYANDLPMAEYRLGQLAIGVAQAYNQQQALGLDALGNPGQDLFNVGAPRVLASELNTGNAQIALTVDDGSLVANSDYVLTRTAGQYRLTRLSDSLETIVTGFPQVVDGVQIDLVSGTMADGDSMLLKTASSFADQFSVGLTSPRQWATSYPALPIVGDQNAGTLTVGDFQVQQMDPNVTEPVLLTFPGDGTVVVTGNGTGNPGPLPWNPGDTLSFNGWQITIDGDPQAGDTIGVGPTSNLATDNRNMRQLLALGESPIIDGKSPIQSLSGLVGEVGMRTLSAASDADRSDAWHQSAVAANDRVSGVNLDEEAARLIQYQQAYQAAARLVTASQSMFDALMDATR